MGGEEIDAKLDYHVGTTDVTVKKIEHTVCSRTHTLEETDGDVRDYVPFCAEDLHGDFDSFEKAVAKVREITGAPDAAKLYDQRGGIGAIEHVVAWVDAYYYDGDEYVSCDANGNPDDTIGCLYECDAIDCNPKLKAAWEKAVRAKREFLDYESEGWLSVRDYLEIMED